MKVQFPFQILFLMNCGIDDADLEEFDFLLFLNNNILQNKETLENFIISTEKII